MKQLQLAMNKPMSQLTYADLRELYIAGYIEVSDYHDAHLQSDRYHNRVLFMLRYADKYCVGHVKMGYIGAGIINVLANSTTYIKDNKDIIKKGLVKLVDGDKKASFNELLWRLEREFN